MANATAQIREVVIVVHGIRDFGAWQPSIVRALTTRQRNVIPLKYGFFAPLFFLAPIPWFRPKVAWLKEQIQVTREDFPQAKIAIIAHSFGTYLISQVLKDEHRHKFHRIILCGGIIPKSFRWQDVKNCLEFSPSSSYIINECGNGDYWPICAEAAHWRYGRTGTDGFGDASVFDRYHHGRHSVFLTEEFARKFWLPFFDGERVESTVQPLSEINELLSRFCTRPFIYFTRALVAFLYLAVLCFVLYCSSLFGTALMSTREIDQGELSYTIEGRQKWYGLR